MNIHLPFDEEWSHQNKVIRGSLGLADDPRFTIQIYTSISHALAEVCFALGDLIPHKKTLVHFKDLGPSFDSVAVSLSKREMTIRSFSRDEILKPEYLNGLSKELLLLITSVDDPIVAARHDFSFLAEQLKEKKYFHIKLSNFQHFSEPVQLPTHYEVLILPLSLDRTLVIAGERAKLRPEIAPKLKVEWSQGLDRLTELSLFETGRELNPKQSVKLNADAQKNRQQILAFEKNLPKGIKAFFTTENRIFDRSVLICEGVDGLSIGSRLSNSGGIETTSLCKWQDAKLFEYLYRQNHTPESLRGMILIDVKLLSAEFKNKLEKVYKELLSEQNETLQFS